MTRHTIAFKLEIVRRHATGLYGYKALGRESGVGFPLVRRWVLFYKFHGEAGLAPKKATRYSAQEKWAVLQFMWDHKLSCLETAARFNIRAQCSVAEWQRRWREGGIVRLQPNAKAKSSSMSEQKKKSEAGVPLDDWTRPREELVAELEQLRMELAYTKKLKALMQSNDEAAARKKRK